MQIRPYVLACAIVSSLYAPRSAAHADAAPPDTPPEAGVPIAKVEVAGARYDARRMDTASRIVIDSAELLRFGDTTLADALKRLPGISIGAGAGQASEIRLRGLGSGYTQILLNGVAAPNGFTFESIAPDLIERVEILRTASAELGTQAIAGTVNIVLKKTATRAAASVKVGAELQTGRTAPSLRVELSDKRDGTSYTVPLALVRSSVEALSQEEQVASERNGALTLARRTRQLEGTLRDELNLSPRLNWTLANADTLSAQSFINLSRRVIDSQARETLLFGQPSAFPERSAQFRIGAALVRSDLSWTHRVGEGARVELTGGVSLARRYSNFVFGALVDDTPGPAQHLVDSGIGELGAHLDGKLNLPLQGGHALVLGWNTAAARRQQTRLEHTFTPDGLPLAVIDQRYDGRIDSAALFAQDDWEINASSSISAGLRWESLRTSVSDHVGEPVRQRSSVLSPIVETLLKLSVTDQLRFGLTRTYKAPTMFQLVPRRYVIDNDNNPNNPDTEGNPALRPELAWGLDAAWEHYFGKDGMVGMSVFARRIDDVTLQYLYQSGARWISTPQNAGRASVRGAVWEAKLPLKTLFGDAPAIDLRANLARNWSHVDSVPGPDNRLDSQVPYSANVGIDYQANAALSVGATLTLEGGGPVRLSAHAASSADAKRGLDLYAVFKLADKTRLRIGAANLLQRDHRSALYYDADGASARSVTTDAANATLRITLERDIAR